MLQYRWACIMKIISQNVNNDKEVIYAIVSPSNKRPQTIEKQSFAGIHYLFSFIPGQSVGFV
jgi:hypothetical protein